MPDRIVRSGILTSDAVNSLSWPGEVFYRRLMSVVDDYGLFDARLSILRSQLYPLKIDRVTEPDIGKWISECETAGLVRVYSVESKPYIEIVKFDQRLRQKRAKWPRPPSIDSNSPSIDSNMRPETKRNESESETKRNGNEMKRSFTHAREDSAERFAVLAKEICEAYARKSNRLTYAEESTLAELCRSPQVADEWIELQAYKARLPQDRKRFFPGSIESLLLNWHKTLDTSRNRNDDAPKSKDWPKHTGGNF